MKLATMCMCALINMKKRKKKNNRSYRKRRLFDFFRQINIHLQLSFSLNIDFHSFLHIVRFLRFQWCDICQLWHIRIIFDKKKDLRMRSIKKGLKFIDEGWLIYLFSFNKRRESHQFFLIIIITRLWIFLSLIVYTPIFFFIESFLSIVETIIRQRDH